MTGEASAAYITWMRRPWILAVAAALIVPGCGRSSDSQPSLDRSELRISEVRVPNSRIPIEGEISYVRVTNGHGATVLSAKIPFGGKAIRMRLRNGSYTVVVWHRFCDANCGTLDPPAPTVAGMQSTFALEQERMSWYGTGQAPRAGSW